MILKLFLLLVSTTLAADITLDSRLQENLNQIFGTALNTSEGKPASEDVIVKKNMEEIFGSPKGPGENRAGGFDLDPSPVQPLTECIRADNNKPGVCVVYYQCDPETKRLITDGETLIDIRISACPHYLDVCCLPEDVNTTMPVTTTVPPPDSKTHECGYSNFGDEERVRIVNDGSYAEFLEYPWMVAVLKKSQPGIAWSQKDYLGGGTLIHPTVVLTAAHKVDGFSPEEIKCRAGEWDTQTKSEVYREQEQNVKKIITHENYYRPPVLNSISLLILEQPYRPAPNIGVACVGRNLPQPGTRCFGMGWGKDNFNAQDIYAAILKKVELPLVSRANCQNALRRTRLGSFFELHQSLTCAGGEEGKDTCGGDGGSPLVCPIGDPKDLRYAVYGMVAYGIGCGESNVPGVYVNTVEFYKWIGDQIRAEGLTTDSYTIKQEV